MKSHKILFHGDLIDPMTRLRAMNLENTFMNPAPGPYMAQDPPSM